MIVPVSDLAVALERRHFAAVQMLRDLRPFHAPVEHRPEESPEIVPGVRVLRPAWRKRQARVFGAGNK